MSEALRTTLARHRAQPMLEELSARQSEQEQKRIILNKACSYLAPFGYSGPAFDLETMVEEDPRFRLPGKSRADTERIVAEAVQETKVQFNRWAKEESSKQLRQVLRLLYFVVVMFVCFLGFMNLSHISDFLANLLGR